MFDMQVFTFDLAPISYLLMFEFFNRKGLDDTIKHPFFGCASNEDSWITCVPGNRQNKLLTQECGLSYKWA